MFIILFPGWFYAKRLFNVLWKGLHFRQRGILYPTAKTVWFDPWSFSLPNFKDTDFRVSTKPASRLKDHFHKLKYANAVKHTLYISVAENVMSAHAVFVWFVFKTIWCGRMSPKAVLRILSARRWKRNLGSLWNPQARVALGWWAEETSHVLNVLHESFDQKAGPDFYLEEMSEKCKGDADFIYWHRLFQTKVFVVM